MDMKRSAKTATLICVLCGLSTLLYLSDANTVFANRNSPFAQSIDRDDASGDTGWFVTGGSSGGNDRYSSLAHINRENVQDLKVAWKYRHGDMSPPKFPYGADRASAFESTPVLVEGLLIFTTPFNRVIALNPTDGREVWAYDPGIDLTHVFSNMMNNRGVAYAALEDQSGKIHGRVYVATLDARLIALDVRTGRPDPEFGDAGQVNLLDGIDFIVDPLEYYNTSPPTVIGDVIVVGSAISDMVRRIQPPGFVRAFDLRSGRLRWKFNTIPEEGEFGAETWENASWKIHGGANVWTTMAADYERNLIFLPVSTAGPDFYGGDRPGSNLFSDSIVALNAATGERVWHFQTVHHDLWDYDLAAPPMLVTIKIDGQEIDTVVQLTKTGLVFVLDRESGTTIFDVEERPVPQGGVASETVWVTQPFPVKPPPLVRHTISEKDLWDDDPKHFKKCLKRYKSLNNEGVFTPPSEMRSLIIPGTAGGANWSGGAFDPESDRLYVPVNNFLMTIRLQKLSDANFQDTDGKVLDSLIGQVKYVTGQRGTGLRYAMHRALFGIGEVQCVKPPWGKMVAIDLRKGEIMWDVPVGENKDGVRGLISFGPPLVTAGGLVFHGGTTDQKLYAYDSESGRVVTSFDLPAGLHAGPITYQAQGRQYLVVAPGGHSQLGSKIGDFIIAYSLPK